jgi:hypothetical protein
MSESQKPGGTPGSKSFELQPNSERRSSDRLKAQVPVTINQKEAGKLTGQSRDLSMGGIFLYTDHAFEKGSELELVLVLPAELTGGQKQWVCCRGSVVRVEAGANGGFGVAARLDGMSAMPELSS